MQTSLILPIILKDLRANLWWFAAFFWLAGFAAFFCPLAGYDWAINLGAEGSSFRASLHGLDGISVLFAMFAGLLGALVIVPRVVLADPPATDSDTPFWATRPVSGSTLFLAKALLILGACVVIPQLLAAAAQLLAGLPPAEVLTTLGGSLLIAASSYSFYFAICAMAKSTKSYIGWLLLALVGFGTLASAVLSVSLVRFVVSAGWPEMSGIYAALVTGGSLWSLIFLPTLVSTVGEFGVAYHQYVRRNTFRSAMLLLGVMALSLALAVPGLQQTLRLPAVAKKPAELIPADALGVKLTDLYPSEMNIKPDKDGVQVSRTPDMVGQFLVSNWPEDVHAIAMTGAAVSFDLDGRRETTPFLPKKQMAFHNGLPVVSIHQPGQLFLTDRGEDRTTHGSWTSRTRKVVTKEPFVLPFAWPPPGLANGLPPAAENLTMTLDLAVFRHETKAVLPLQKGATARFGDRIVTVRNVTPSPRLRNVKVEIEEKKLQDSFSLGLGGPCYRLKSAGTGGVLLDEASRDASNSYSFSPVVRRHVELTFLTDPDEESSPAHPLDDETIGERVAAWLKDAELVVSEIAPAGTIQREAAISGEARIRVMHATRPGSHRPDHAKLVLEDAEKIPADRRELVGIGHFRLILDFGSALSEPTLKVHVPEAMRGEFDALPDDKARYAWLAERVRAQMEAGDAHSADGYATLLLHGLGVARNLPEAKVLLRDAITRHDFASARKYVELRLLDPDQPEGVRDSMDLMVALLEAGHLNIFWSTGQAMDILAASPSESDRPLESRLVTASGQALHRAFSEATALAAPVKEKVDWAAPKVLGKLVDLGSPQDLALAEEIVAAWLSRDPENATARWYRDKLNTL